MDSLRTLAPSLPSSSSSAAAIAANSRCVFHSRSSRSHALFLQRNLRNPCNSTLFFGNLQSSVKNVTRLEPVSAVFYSAEARTGIRKRRKQAAAQDLEVEREIFRFMQESGRPNVFPTKEELIAAGRSDLVEAALKRGGWLTVGWDYKRKKGVSGSENGRLNGSAIKAHSSGEDNISRDENNQLNIERQGEAKRSRKAKNMDKQLPVENDFKNKSRRSNGKTRNENRRVSSAEDHDAKTRDENKLHLARLTADNDVSQRQVEKLILDKESSEQTLGNTLNGIPEGNAPSLIRTGVRRRKSRKNTDENSASEVLNAEANHERWRRKRRKEAQTVASDNTSVKNALDWIQDMVQKREQWILETKSKPLKQKNEVQRAPSSKLPVDNLITSQEPIKNVGKGRTDSSNIFFMDSLKETTPKDEREKTSSNIYLKSDPVPSKELKTRKSSDISDSVEDANSFNARLRKLETKLLATRAALKSGRAALLKGEDQLLQVQRKAGENFAKAADSLEFKENEIMQTRAELRRTRAQVTALQAKMAVELSEARKATEEKQILLEKAEKALKMMRLVRIVWPNPASHVLLTGSFDGWTNKIKMEKSSAGVFVTALHLYPGRYEVKFIVDGTWRVDPCRPITYADGIENNVLMVS